MARTAITELQQQIEAVRREAFAAGYAAAMEAIRELTSRAAAPGTRSAAATPTRRGRGRGRGRARARQAAPAAKATPARRRRARTTRTTRTTRATRTARTATAAARTRRPAARRPQRGTNARMIEEILKAAAPRAIPPAEIRKALQANGVAMAFTSIRHALGQLEQRNAAEQVGDSRTWRHRGGAS
jgi:hypothetical protein